MRNAYDRTCAIELVSFDTLLYSQWRALGELVDRHQNEGAFTEAEWTALRDYYAAWQQFVRARSAARKVFEVTP